MERVSCRRVTVIPWEKLGTTYAIWSGVGTALTAIVGIICFRSCVISPCSASGLEWQ